MICALYSSSCVDDVLRQQLGVRSSRSRCPPRPSRRPEPPGLERAVVRDLLDRVVDGRVDPLQHRGHDQRLLLGARRQVLVGVDADRELVGLDRRLEQPGARCAGGVVDDARRRRRTSWSRAPRPATGSLNAAVSVADVLDQHLDVRVRSPCDAGLVAGLELLDQRAGLAAEEADRVAARSLAFSAAATPTRNEPSCSLNVEVGRRSAIAVVRDVEQHVGPQVANPSIDRELRVRVVRRDLVDRRREREPDRR